MDLNVNVRFSFGDDGLAAFTIALNQLTSRINIMSTQLDALRAAVQSNTTVTESAIVLLTGLKTKLDEAIAAGDPAALQALSDTLGSETTKLADAIVANTPAA